MIKKLKPEEFSEDRKKALKELKDTGKLAEAVFNAVCKKWTYDEVSRVLAVKKEEITPLYKQGEKEWKAQNEALL